MMPITFEIKKLGPITNSTFQFKPFMIFSGESSLGKSYSAFLVYYFISLFSNKRLNTFIEQQFKIDDLKDNIKNKDEFSINIIISDIERWLNYSSSNYLGYLIGNETFESDIQIKLDIKDFAISFKKTKKEIIEKNQLLESDTFKIKLGEKNFNVSISAFQQNTVAILRRLLEMYFLRVFFKKESPFHTLFLPPARAALVGANFSTTKEIISNAGMYKEFLKDMEGITAPQEDIFHPSKNIKNLMKDLFSGDIKNNKGVLSYNFNNENIPITAAASSVKELSPMFLLLNKFNPKDFSVLFEEPEAHLHPSLQMKVADMICTLVNEGAFFQITTHSDYFLNEINNLLRLYKIKQKQPQKFEDICNTIGHNKTLILDPKKVGAYYFKQRSNGTVEIIQQNCVDGIPFETFEKSVDSLMDKSSRIEDLLENME